MALAWTIGSPAGGDHRGPSPRLHGMAPDSPRLRVLHVTPHLALGGAERLLVELTRAQAGRVGYSVGLASADGELAGELAPSVRFFPMPGYVLQPPPAADASAHRGEAFSVGAWRRAMRAALASFQPDVVHAHAFQVLVPWLDLCAGRRKVLTVHSSRWSRAVLGVAASAVGCSVAFVSSDIALSVKRLLPRPLRARVTSVPNGTEVAYWSSGAVAGTERDRAKRVLWVGRLIELKRPAAAIDLFERARRTCPGLELVMVGAGPLEAAVRERARSSEAAEAITLLGSCNREEMRALYRGASMLLLTSSREGLPMVTLEAMAAGCMPVLPDLASLLVPALDGCEYYRRGDLDHGAKVLAAYAVSPRPVPAARSTDECADDYDTLYRGHSLSIPVLGASA
jgi:glycosyltransferase involved in cell wall biosynthesis